MRHHNCVTTGLALRLWQVALSRFLSFAALLCLSLSFTAIPALGQSNPVPFVNQPLVPSAVAPGGPDFTLTVNGTGFVSGASEGTCPSCSIGGNGGSGAFGEAVLTVAPGASLTIVVGAGGAGGAVNTTNSGGSGGTTEIKDATGTVLLSVVPPLPPEFVELTAPPAPPAPTTM